MNPGNALFRYLGLMFYKYVGNADVTFRELYDAYGVELAICVTNVTRASSELLHVKTSPNYPIRKAVRMSMSLPIIIQPCKEVNVHGLVHEPPEMTEHSRSMRVARNKVLTETSVKRSERRTQAREALREESMRDDDEKPVLKKSGSSFSSKMPTKNRKWKRDSEAASPEASMDGRAAVAASRHKTIGIEGEKELPITELYVDGGVLNNYPIDAFDGAPRSDGDRGDRAPPPCLAAARPRALPLTRPAAPRRLVAFHGPRELLLP